MAKKRARKGGFIRRLAVWFLVIAVVIPVGLTAIYRFVPPPITFLMIQRMFEGHGLHRRWRPLSQISPALPRAVIAAEDQRFCEHNGFDFEAIEKAMQHNERRPNRIRAAPPSASRRPRTSFCGRSALMSAKGWKPISPS